MRWLFVIFRPLLELLERLTSGLNGYYGFFKLIDWSWKISNLLACYRFFIGLEVDWINHRDPFAWHKVSKSLHSSIPSFNLSMSVSSILILRSRCMNSCFFHKDNLHFKDLSFSYEEGETLPRDSNPLTCKR
ncbi:hypothetical protein VNO77_23410 [Canavalia gladiata]|uniref:Uncharacterized protein n=1 Tax=Canavalia gladiata TaxID=3824 RepID=A0AAN9L6V6_CANGL